MMRAMLRGRPRTGVLGLVLGVWLVLVPGFAARPAAAFGIPIQTAPDGFDLTPFPSLSPTWVVRRPLDWLPAGAREFDDPMNPFTLVIDETASVVSNPYGQTPSALPSSSNPFVVDITWTVENNTDTTLDNVLLFLPRLEPPGATSPDYTGVPVEVEWDPASLVVVQFPDPNTALEYYLAFLIQDLDPGEQATVMFQYSILAPLPPDPTTAGALGAPIFQVAAATRFFPVPEPALAALLASVLGGLAGRRLAASRARRCA